MAFLGTAFVAPLFCSADKGEEVSSSEKRDGQTDIDRRTPPCRIFGSMVDGFFLFRRQRLGHPFRQPVKKIHRAGRSGLRIRHRQGTGLKRLVLGRHDSLLCPPIV